MKQSFATEQWLGLLNAADLDTQLHVGESVDGAFLRSNAEHLAKGWAALSVPKQREIFLSVGFRVRIRDRRVEISAEPGKLAGLLLKSGNTPNSKMQSKTRRVSKAVEASLVKTAGETRILEEQTSVIANALTPGHQTLLRAIAHGRAWARALTNGEISSAEEISVTTGLSAAHVARGLKCVEIYPDLVEQLAQGKGPADLTWATIRSIHAHQWDAALCRWRTIPRT